MQGPRFFPAATGARNRDAGGFNAGSGSARSWAASLTRSAKPTFDYEVECKFYGHGLVDCFTEFSVPGSSVFTSISTGEKPRPWPFPLNSVNSTLWPAYLGSNLCYDFNFLNRTDQVNTRRTRFSSVGTRIHWQLTPRNNKNQTCFLLALHSTSKKINGPDR